MQYVEGKPLDELLSEKPAREKLMRWVSEVARGLDHSHDKGLIHRDVKPANILIDRSGKALLTDFGLARDLGQASLSNSGDLIGTPLYMAPEQINARIGKVDRRTDVFALGVMMYQFLTDSLPFPARSLAELHRLLLHEAPTAPRKRDESIPPDLQAICLKALQKKPKDRYQTARDMATDIERHLQGEPVELGQRQSRTSRSQSEESGPDRNLIVMIGAAVSVFVILLGLGGRSFWRLREHSNRAAAHQSQQASWRDSTRKGLQSLEREAPPLESPSSASADPALDKRIRMAIAKASKLLALFSKIDNSETTVQAGLEAVDERLRLAFARRLKTSPGGLDEAISLLSEAAVRPSATKETKRRLLELMLRRGRADAALPIAQALCHEKPTAEDLLARARAHRISGHPHFAAVDFALLGQQMEASKALRDRAQEGIVLSLLDRGALKKAARQLRRFDPSASKAPFAWARLYQQEGNMVQAMTATEYAIQREPNRIELLRFRARLRLHSLDFRGAESDLAKVLETRPDGPSTLLLKAYLAYMTGHEVSARKDLARLITPPKDAIQPLPSQRLAAKLLVIRLERAEGNRKTARARAATLLHSIAKKGANSAQWSAVQAERVELRLLNRKELRKGELQELIDRIASRQSPRLLRLLARLAQRRKDNRRARTYLVNVISKEPLDFAALKLRADLHRIMTDSSEGNDFDRKALMAYQTRPTKLDGIAGDPVLEVRYFRALARDLSRSSDQDKQGRAKRLQRWLKNLLSPELLPRRG